MCSSSSGLSAGRSTLLAVYLAFALGAGHLPHSHATPNELGRPMLRNFTPGEYFRNAICQAVTQDATGIIYFGNASDVLTFDGATWGPRLLQVSGVLGGGVQASSRVVWGGPLGAIVEGR